MEYDTIVRVENVGEDPIVFWHANKPYSIIPGKSSLVPFEAICAEMGDPRSGPQVAQIQRDDGTTLRIINRAAEIKRLSILYGTYEYDRADLILPLYPKIIVTNLDDDTPIIFPAQDPDCTQYSPMEVDQSQMAMMQRQLDKLRRQQLVLEQQLKGTERNAESTVSAAEIGEDTPQPVTAGRTPARK